MILHSSLSDKEVFRLLKQQQILFAGNKKLKIYGTLHCASGKRMKKENRLFFTSLNEALAAGYRPCGHCLRNDYNNRKHNGSI